MPLTEPEAGSDDANSPPSRSSTQLTDGHRTTTPSSFEANREEGEGTANKEDNMAATTQQSQKRSSNSREQRDREDTNRDQEPRTSQRSSHSNSTKRHRKT